MKIYKCNECGVDSQLENEFFMIGSEDGQSFKYKRKYNADCNRVEMNKHSDIHLCSKKCFKDFFLGVKF